MKPEKIEENEAGENEAGENEAGENEAGENEFEQEESEDDKLRRAMLKRMEYSRSEHQICQNCCFWEFEYNKGRCKRYPPSVKSGPTNRIDMWEFPEVTYDQWCGEWQLFPNIDGYYAGASLIDDIDDEE